MSQIQQHPRFVFLLSRAHNALQHWIETRPGAWNDISPAQARLLFFLRFCGSATIGETAAALHVAPATVTNLSKQMQKAGLVNRIVDDQDSRKMCLSLTKAGEIAGFQAYSSLQKLNKRLSLSFTDAELAVVARWLTQVITLEHKPDRH